MPVEQFVIDDLLERVRAEYREMPGHRLTLEQAARFWSLDRTTCTALLDVLVSTGFLRRTVVGAYVRADAGPSNGSRRSARRLIVVDRAIDPGHGGLSRK